MPEQAHKGTQLLCRNQAELSLLPPIKSRENQQETKQKATTEHVLLLRAQRLCENRGGRPGLPVLTNLMISVDVKHCRVSAYNTTLLSLCCVEKLAFWLVIYIKTFNTIKNKTSASMKHGAKNHSNTRKILSNNNVQTHTHARTHVRTNPPTHPHPPTHTHTHTFFFCLTSNLKHSINFCP